MCGIVGVVGRQDIAPLLVEALRRLEYRGYDSAGVAAISEARIERRRVEGKVQRLADKLAEEPLPGRTGIAHTRWATHGAPCERNAHPIATDRVAVVHNGIIENYRELRDELEWLGHRFESQTDTEAVAVLLTRCLQQGMTPVEAVSATLARISGAFALAILFAGHDDMLVCARRGSPLAIGYGEGEMFVGSDALALGPMTQRISYLEDGDWALLTPAGAQICDAGGNPVYREIRRSTVSGASVGKGNHRHYMQKEIFEQPAAIGDTLRSLLDPATRGVVLPPLPFSLGEVERAIIVGCGTSHHAGLVARYWAEGIAGVPVQVDIASEFRYRRTPVPPRTLVVGISQSGETADTLAALRQAKAQGARTLGIVNQPESTMEREVDAVIRTLAGPEIGVASTKAFTTQLVVLACMAIALGRARGAIDGPAEEALVRAIADTPAAIAEVLAADAEMREIAGCLAAARDVLYLGRGTAFPIALEGALKLKEISYVHAEGYAAGELKHGPIALIDGSVPVVVVAPPDELMEKTASNMQEVMARGGQVIAISSAEGLARLGGETVARIRLPEVAPLAAPLVYSIPMQLLAYHAAVLRGTEVDQPRNLAKSVTVE
jgi:glucosamine--fructose-6-phosphate aminotransferase (isomerizing)